MFRSRIRRRLAAADGFTLVELLVAILIVGILAALGLAAFVNQRQKAQDTAAKTHVVTAAKAMSAYETQRGDYSGADADALVKIEPALGEARNLDVQAAATTYTITVDSPAGGGAKFSLERQADGSVVRTCTRADVGSCLTGNRW